jgi:membrane-associated phospholipid phosphatase
LNVSLFFGPFRAFWEFLDRSCFLTLNNYVREHPLQQIFWALANIRITDIFGALYLLGTFVLYVFEAKNEERKFRGAQLLYTLIWFEISILLCKQVLTPLLISLGAIRHGPSVSIPHCCMLSEAAPWEKIKDSSLFCYPADHGTIVIQWCVFFIFFAGWRRSISVCLFSIFLLLPRLIAGAHWLSDLLVGSTSIVACIIAWAMYSPLYDILFPKILQVFRYRLPKLKDST